MKSICTKTNIDMLHACIRTNTHLDLWRFSVLGGTEINLIVRPCKKGFETLGVGLRYVAATWRTANVRRDRQRRAQKVTCSENVHSYQLTLRKNSDLHTATLKNVTSTLSKNIDPHEGTLTNSFYQHHKTLNESTDENEGRWIKIFARIKQTVLIITFAK
jgi:hypothetical protein